MLNEIWLDLMQELTAIERAETPFLSVYLDIRPDGAARRESLTFLHQAILDHNSDRKPVPYHGVALRGFQEDLAWLNEYMGDYSGGQYDPASHGIAFFACGARGMRRVVELPVPVENRFLIGEEPALAPLAATIARYPDYVVALVDSDSCRVFTVSLTEVTARAERQGDTADLSWTARGGGWSQKRYQRHIDHWRSRFAAESGGLVAETLAQAGAPYLVLAGEPWATAELRRHLPEAVLAAVIGTEHLEVDWANEARIIAATEPLVEAEHQRRAGAEADRVLTARGEGRPSAVGIGPTLQALEQGAVSELILPPVLAAPVWRCDRCGHASEGEPPERCPVDGGPARAVDAAELMLRSALAQDATLRYVAGHEELGSYGGVGALLRFGVRA